MGEEKLRRGGLREKITQRGEKKKAKRKEKRERKRGERDEKRRKKQSVEPENLSREEEKTRNILGKVAESFGKEEQGNII